jgi:hypothetical protein
LDWFRDRGYEKSPEPSPHGESGQRIFCITDGAINRKLAVITVGSAGFGEADNGYDNII